MPFWPLEQVVESAADDPGHRLVPLKGHPCHSRLLREVRALNDSLLTLAIEARPNVVPYVVHVALIKSLAQTYALPLQIGILKSLLRTS